MLTMPIPDYQTLMLPVLSLASDGQEHTLREAYEKLAAQFDLTEQERKELLPSGQQEVFHNRVGWARTYLKMAGLLGSKRRGYFHITDRGRKTLAENLSQINTQYLENFEEFRHFKARKHTSQQNKEQPNTTAFPDVTPEEQLEAAYQALNSDLAAELLQMLKSSSASFFEKIVFELLVSMGYGGSRQDAGQAIGKTGDEGIDGIIKEDRLGLDIIYIQAKRWDSTVGRPEIQKFAGALQGQRARKGVFITTGLFSQEAHNYVSSIESKIILIDGNRLAQLMIDHDVGVTTISSYSIKRLDSDYFTDE